MRHTVRRASIILALTPVVSVPATSAFAALHHPALTSRTSVTTPAPAGDASAVGAEVNGVLAIGKTKAHAGSGGGSSSADGLTVLGHRVAGGDQNGVGSSHGDIAHTGDTPLGDAEVAPWFNQVGNTGGGYQAHAEAALAHVNIAKVAEVWLLHSQSDATWTPDKSTGDAQSDGAEVSALGLLDVKVLHSEAHSNGKSQSDLLVVNGTEIGSSDQVNGACKLALDPVLSLICLTASGGSGDGTTSSGADGGLVDVGGGSLTGTLSGAGSQGGVVSSTPTTPQHHKTTHHRRSTQRGPLPHTTGPSTRGSLPFTGAEIGRMTAIAGALAAIGMTLQAFARRRRYRPAH